MRNEANKPRRCANASDVCGCALGRDCVCATHEQIIKPGLERIEKGLHPFSGEPLEPAEEPKD